MKAFAKFLTAITVLALLALAYVVYTSNLIVRYDGMTVVSCADYADTFRSVRDFALRGTSDVTVFSEAPGMNAEDYKFVTYTVNVRNLDVLDAEWMDLTIQGKPGDYLQVNPQAADLPGFNDATLSVILLCDRGVTDLTREATLTYYVYGRYREITITLNG